MGGLQTSPASCRGIGGERGPGKGGGAWLRRRREVCSFLMCVIPGGLCLFVTVWLEPTRGTLLLAFASHSWSLCAVS